MEKSKLVLANFDARISKIDIKPKNDKTKVIISSRMYDEEIDKVKTTKITFVDVAAIDFRINYFDNMIGAEAFGLFEITDSSFKEKLVREIFERRREVYLLQGNYDYDEEDEHDMLNMFDVYKSFEEEKDSYHTYVQNVDAGVYVIVAKEIAVF